jgi:hypothetical protein
LKEKSLSDQITMSAEQQSSTEQPNNENGVVASDQVNTTLNTTESAADKTKVCTKMNSPCVN